MKFAYAVAVALGLLGLLQVAPSSAAPDSSKVMTMTTTDPDDPDFNLLFPDAFVFSSATASYQVEGAWNVSGKGENIWDRFTHEHPEKILDHSNGDVADDSYHKYKEDIRLAKEIGTKMYRFSLSWSRLLPTGMLDQVNQDGIRYYNAVLDELIANGIEPLVTIFHWDLPQPLQDLGGLPNEVIVDYFVDFCDFAFETFGARVKYWLTHNEPYTMCNEGYGNGGKAPAVPTEGRGDYLCAHNVLRSHAKVYRLYQDKYKATQQGKIGMASFSSFMWPKDSNNADDVAAAERWQQFQLGWFMHPIFGKGGDYPAVMRQYVDAASKAQGLKRSRLPTFTQEEISTLIGSADFFGLNHYTSNAVADAKTASTPPKTGTKLGDAAVEVSFDPEWETSIADWLKVVPEGFRKLLNWIKNEYNNPEILILEQGYPDAGDLRDEKRVNYYRTYLLQLLKAMHHDNVTVIGYTAWSLVDNYEWLFGYAHRYGLHHVDYSDPERPRTPKMSAAFFKQLIATRKIPKDSDINYTTPALPSTTTQETPPTTHESPATTQETPSTTPSGSNPSARAWSLLSVAITSVLALVL